MYIFICVWVFSLMWCPVRFISWGSQPKYCEKHVAILGLTVKFFVFSYVYRAYQSYPNVICSNFFTGLKLLHTYD